MNDRIARSTLAVLAVLAVAVAPAVLPGPAAACSRIFWNDNPQAKVVARTVDLFRSDEATVAVFPRGVVRKGVPGEAGGLEWKAKHASVVATAFGVATSDGMNEKGLSANLLYLDESQYEPRDARPALSNLMWAQYVLDNFATVDEALASLDRVQVVTTPAAGREWPLHLAIGDAGGDSAIIEFQGGKAVVHHGEQYAVMTNEPALDVQLANLKHYKLFGGDRSMPGDIDPMSRFVRASSYLKTLPAPKDVAGAVAGVYGVARTVGVPFGAEDTSTNVTTDTWPTLWFAVADLTNRVYYFHSTSSPNMFWLDLDDLPVGEGEPVRMVDAYDRTLEGNVAARLLSPSAAKLG